MSTDHASGVGEFLRLLRILRPLARTALGLDRYTHAGYTRNWLERNGAAKLRPYQAIGPKLRGSISICQRTPSEGCGGADGT